MTDDLIRRKDALNFEFTVEGPREAEEAILRTSQGIMDYIKSLPAASTPTTFMQPIVVDFESIGRAIGEALEKDDIVEVVRCENCKWYEPDIMSSLTGVCCNPGWTDGWVGYEVEPDGYCYRGERREDG